MSLPILLRAEGRRAAVVGATTMATEKADLLSESGFLVAHFTGPQSRDPGGRGITAWPTRADLSRSALVVAASETQIDGWVLRTCRELGVLVNTADVPDQCDFYFQAIARSGPITLSVSSDGTSPAIAKRIRDEARARLLTDELADWARAMGRARGRVKQQLASGAARRDFWNGVLNALWPAGTTPQGTHLAEQVVDDMLREVRL